MSRLACVLGAVALLAACSHGSSAQPAAPHTGTTAPGASTSQASTTTIPPSAQLLLAVHDGALDAVAATAPFTVQTLLAPGRRSTQSITARGPVCVSPRDPHIVAFGATTAGLDATAVAVVRVSGAGVGGLELKLVSTLAPTLAGATITGCTFLSDGRLVVAERVGDRSGRLVTWTAPDAQPATPCVVDDSLARSGPLATLANDEVLASAAPTSGRPGLYADDIATDACGDLTPRRLAVPVPGATPPTALVAVGRGVVMALANGRVVSVVAGDAPANVARFTATVAGLAGAADGTLYATTTRDAPRAGALWTVTRSGRNVAMATAWSAAGGVVLTAAPDR